MRHRLHRLLQRLYFAALPERIGASLSENQTYPQFCLDASSDFLLFNHFRRNPVYNRVLEHVSQREGSEYLRVIAQDPAVLAAIAEFQRNDRHGDPRRFAYPGIGTISPTTLRYVKVLADLKAHFHTLDRLAVCEIGVGYGGQCRIINAYFTPASYCLVDLQPALALTQRYLDNYVLPSPVAYRTMNELAACDYDLVLSNYAFTELPRALQEVYLSKVILRSRRGYITYNEITPSAFNSYRAQELSAMIPGAEILNEVPLTHPRNCIIVWGHAAAAGPRQATNGAAPAGKSG